MQEHDPTVPQEEQGYYRKYIVKRADGRDGPGDKHEGCEYFTLDLTHDPHAYAALRAYAYSCRNTHPQLCADLHKLCERIPRFPE